MSRPRKYNYSSGWIHTLEGMHHWMYYWYQIRHIRERIREGDSLLEIGVGTQFTTNYMRSKGYEVTTLDIDPEKKPDIVGNIAEMQLPGTYDLILAFEVFEHMPFEDFKKVLRNLYSKCGRYLILSIPRNEKLWLECRVTLPGYREIGFRLARPRKKIITANHHWEVDYPPYSKKRIEQTFRDHGFRVESVEKVSSLYFYALSKER